MANKHMKRCIIISLEHCKLKPGDTSTHLLEYLKSKILRTSNAEKNLE